MTVTEESKDNLIAYYRRELKELEKRISKTKSRKEKERLNETKAMFQTLLQKIKESKKEKEVHA